MDAPKFGFVTERVGKAFDGETRHDRVTREMQGTMNLDKLHRSFVTSEDRQRREANVFAVHGKRVRCFRRDWRRPVSARVTKGSDDVVRFDARPHDGAELGELCANVCELDRQRLLRRVDFLGHLDKGLLFFCECGLFGRTVRETAVSLRVPSGFDHRGFSSRLVVRLAP